jgi:hypothetical protein
MAGGRKFKGEFMVNMVHRNWLSDSTYVQSFKERVHAGVDEAYTNVSDRLPQSIGVKITSALARPTSRRQKDPPPKFSS